MNSGAIIITVGGIILVGLVIWFRKEAERIRK